MLTVRKFKDICDQIVAAIKIDGNVIASTDEQGTKKLKDKPGITLVGVYPSYYFEGKEDEYRDKHDMLYYIVTKQREGDGEESELKQYSDTQDAMIKLKEYFFGDDGMYCKLFPHLDIGSVMIDPEYNIFGGFLGWSMKVTC